MRSPAAGVVLQFGPVVRAVAVLLLALAVAVFVVVSARARAGSGAPRIFLLAVILVLGAAVVDVLGVAHRLGPDGVERVTPWRRRALVRWSEVTSLTWVETTRWFELRARGGERIRVHEQLTGMGAFARAALERVPAGVIDAQPGLRLRLERLARGASPPDAPPPEAWRGG